MSTHGRMSDAEPLADSAGRADNEDMSTHHIDADDLDRVLDNLAVRHGNLEVSAPHPATGSVTIDAADGATFRFTTQSRLIRVSR